MVKPKYSVVIPTYNHLEDFLKPCLQSIIHYTDLTNVEIIVVANGCVDLTHQYVEALSYAYPSIKLIREKDGIGYTKATNLGIKAAQGEYIILLNNDTQLLSQEKNQWLQMLEAPFQEDPRMGITGPLLLHDKITRSRFVVFFCAMIPRTMFDEIGLLDEIYSPGSGEDIDFSVKVQERGYRIHIVPTDQLSKVDSKIISGAFPIYHYAEGTFEGIETYSNVTFKRNSLINIKKYNKDIKLHLTAENDNNLPEHVRVHGTSKYSELILDWNKLDFNDNTVSEIAMNKSIEHISYADLNTHVKEWYRVLKPEGRLLLKFHGTLSDSINEVLKLNQFKTNMNWSGTDINLIAYK